MDKSYIFKNENTAGQFVEYASDFCLYFWKGNKVELTMDNQEIENKMDIFANSINGMEESLPSKVLLVKKIRYQIYKLRRWLNCLFGHNYSDSSVMCHRCYKWKNIEGKKINAWKR